MENKSHALAAGTFVVLVSALAIGLVMWLTRDSSQHRYFEMVTSDSVNGLQPHAAVRYKGVAVGRVTAISLDPAVAGQVLVRIAVNDQVPVTQSTYASLGYQGVTGLAFIQLDDSGESKQMVATSSQNVGRIPLRAGLMARLTDQGGRLLGQMEQVGQRVNGLLSADNQKVLITAIDQIGQAAADVRILVQHADQVFKPRKGQEPVNLPLLADRVLHGVDSLNSSALAFKQVATRISENGGTLDRLAQGTDALRQTTEQLNMDVLPRIGRMSEDVSRAAKRADRVFETLNETPQALIFGSGAPVPGPGEAGFVVPAAAP